MRERGLARVAALEIAFTQIDAMGEHRAPAGKAVMGVDVEVVAPLRE